MRRYADNYLKKWLTSHDRLPLIMRGARQVGKTWLVRELAMSANLQLIELNIEENPSFATLFESNDPNTILARIEAMHGKLAPISQCLLFIDEIQAAPHLLTMLRWFAEKCPELPVIAAGSLLEFTLAQHDFSMPVGRVTYCHIEPLSFEEFLLANKQDALLAYLHDFTWGTTVPETIHSRCIKYFKEYLIVGGMPKAVSTWIQTRSPSEVNRIQHDLLTTYRDDFAKYHGHLAIERLEEVLTTTPKCLGEKFIYKKVNPHVQTPSIKRALDLLTKARLCHKVTGTVANGIPLAAEKNDKFFKVILLDVGLANSLLGLQLDKLMRIDNTRLVNRGGIAEQVVGQLLRRHFPLYMEPNLYYWFREQKGSSSEIDYVIAYQDQVVPIEVKAGSTGTLKSLHFFMAKKHHKLAVRCNLDFPNKTNIDVKTVTGEQVKYPLLSLPFYLIEQLPRLIGIHQS